jgi:hypothetical protein
LAGKRNVTPIRREKRRRNAYPARHHDAIVVLVTAARKLEPTQLPSMGDTSADPLEHGEDWEAEINRRIADQRAGHGRSIPLDEVVADIRAKYGWA